MAISQINTNSIATGAVTAADLASGAITAAALPAGSVLQVVQGTTTTSFTITTSTLTDIVSATITPTSATSKILIFANCASVGKANVNAEGYFTIYKNGSALVNPFDGITPYTGSTSLSGVGSVSCQYLDSPATTSALTYVIKVRDDGSAGLRINWEGGLTSITLMEIAA